MEPAYERTGGVDGRISFELPPDIANDAEASVREARRLFDELARPNVFIKIPATREGVEAVRTSIAAGININVTLIFSIARYREVIEAYLAGMEELADAGGDLTQVASVASFFVSRVDTNVDAKLQRIIDAGGPDAERAAARLGTAAIDNAKLAYEAFEQAFSGPRWEALERLGARVQRPLWASTSTKNPAYRDVVYVEELIADRTVNTMPIATIEAFADHGEVRGQTIKENLERAHALWSDLAELGIDEAKVGEELETEGVEKFAESYLAVLDAVERKRAEAVR
jgi:transaldolase